MGKDSTDKYTAGKQRLGYIYQPRFALLRLLQLPESTSVFIEKDDDLDFEDENGTKTLSSLKHKAVGDRITNLSSDFWKSVRIWLTRYERDGRSAADLRFFLFTTGTVSDTSFLRYFVPTLPDSDKGEISILPLIEAALNETKSDKIIAIALQYHALSEQEKEDFISRIVIFDGAPRITDIPSLIKDQYMRSVRREFRDAIFERLEGWWNNAAVDLLTGKRSEPIRGYEIADKLSVFTDEYKSDSLPITLRGKVPVNTIDTASDPRLFVMQLREIGISSGRIRNAILDYYRAFEQRSSWARETLLVSGEMKEYEARLIDE